MIKSIKVAFEGGLGNQLFQLAYGLHLQSKLRCKVFYDVSKYKVERGEYRQFELENIGIPTDWRRCDISKHSGVLGRIERFGLRYLPYIILTFIFLRTSKATNDCTKKKKISDWYSKAINLIGMHRVHSKFYKDPGTSLFSKMIIYGQWFWTEKVVEQREQIRKILDLSFEKGNCNCALSERIIKSEPNFSNEPVSTDPNSAFALGQYASSIDMVISDFLSAFPPLLKRTNISRASS